MCLAQGASDGFGRGLAIDTQTTSGRLQSKNSRSKVRLLGEVTDRSWPVIGVGEDVSPSRPLSPAKNGYSEKSRSMSVMRPERTANGGVYGTTILRKFASIWLARSVRVVN